VIFYSAIAILGMQKIIRGKGPRIEICMADEQKKDTVQIYEIKIKGHLDTKWSEWFYGLTITHEPDGNTTLNGPLPDQIVLHSVLDRLRDMNLPLLSLKQFVSDGPIINDEVQGVNHEE
jgi:hypothetical protein